MSNEHYLYEPTFSFPDNYSRINCLNELKLGIQVDIKNTKVKLVHGVDAFERFEIANIKKKKAGNFKFLNFLLHKKILT